MTTTQIRSNLHLVTRDGEVIGKVVGTDIHGGRVQARRVRGSEKDSRRVSQGFKTIAAAAAWIAEAA